MLNGTILENIGEAEVLRAIAECEKRCMIDNTEVRTIKKHHIIPDSLDGEGDWTNALFLSANNHDKIHYGDFNEMTFPCVETWVLRHLGIDIETEIKEIDCETTRGVGAGCRMHLFIEIPTSEYHTPFIILDERKKRKKNKSTKILPWSEINKKARQTVID